MKLGILIVFAIVFGTIYTLLRKYQCVATLSDPSQQFNQPLIQAFIIFIGMTSIYVFKPFLPIETDIKQKQVENTHLYILPSFLDVLATICDTTGLFYTSVSVSQLLKGSALFFTYLFTIFFFTKKITVFQHLWMIAIVLSLSLIGYSNIGQYDPKYESNPLFGNCLIVLSQFIFALMFVVEQKILKNHNMNVANAVFWQGLWGVLISGSFLLFFSQFHLEFIKCDILLSCKLIYSNFNLFVALLLTALCIAPFNYFGLQITKKTSALYRSMICTIRMATVWIISLILSWQNFSYLQLTGYIFLIISIYQFHKQQFLEIKIPSEQSQPMMTTVKKQEQIQQQQEELY